MNAEDRVLGQTEIKQQPAAMTILGNMRDAYFLSLARICSRDVAAFESDCAREVRTGNQTSERFDQFGLAVTFDAGNADNLAGAHFERDVIDAF